MGIDDWLQRRWADTIDDLEAWWNTHTRHGCFCGAGASCDEPIDGLDASCKQHDDDYVAVGITADTMWSVAGFTRTVEADLALAASAEGANVDPSHDRSNPDVEGYRQRLIWVFTTRAQIGEWLRIASAAEDNFRDWLDGVKDWVASDATTPDEVRVGFAQQVDFLASLGIEPSEIGEVVRSAGVSPSQLAGDGFDTSAIA